MIETSYVSFMIIISVVLYNGVLRFVYDNLKINRLVSCFSLALSNWTLYLNCYENDTLKLNNELFYYYLVKWNSISNKN